MSRRWTILAACLALCGLSFDEASGPPRAATVPEPLVIAADSREPEAAAIAERLAAVHTGLAPFEERALAETILREAERNELAPDLILAVIFVESRYYNFAVSNVGAMGLMQLLPSTAEQLAQDHGIPWHGAQTLFDPESNVTLGVAYLKWLKDRYGNVSTALAAYNWGPGRIDRRIRGGRPVPSQYVARVLAQRRESASASSRRS